NVNEPAMRGVSMQKLPGLKPPNTIIGAAVPASAGILISWRQIGQRMGVIRKGERASDKNAVPGPQNLLQPHEDRLNRVGRHHLAQNEVVAMKTVVVNRRKADDLRWPAIITD